MSVLKIAAATLAATVFATASFAGTLTSTNTLVTPADQALATQAETVVVGYSLSQGITYAIVVTVATGAIALVPVSGT
jgi:hypothetical protein